MPKNGGELSRIGITGAQATGASEDAPTQFAIKKRSMDVKIAPSFFLWALRAT